MGTVELLPFSSPGKGSCRYQGDTNGSSLGPRLSGVFGRSLQTEGFSEARAEDMIENSATRKRSRVCLASVNIRRIV